MTKTTINGYSVKNDLSFWGIHSEKYLNSVVNRLNTKILPLSSPNDCWIYNYTGGGKCTFDLQTTTNKRIKVKPHRLVYHLCVEDSTNYFCVNRCIKSKLCVNPSHLSANTDMKKSGKRCLTNAEILDIVGSFKLGISRKQLAKKYNVSSVSINDIISGRSYTNISRDIFKRPKSSRITKLNLNDIDIYSMNILNFNIINDFSIYGIHDHNYVKSVVNRINKKLLPQSNGCIFYDNKPDSNGYYLIGLHYRSVLYITTKVHRLLYHLCVGTISPELDIRHICNTPACINPNHLLIGTHADNMKDKCLSGNASKLLTIPEVIKIRELFDTRKYTRKQLSIKYNVSYNVIRGIVARKSWIHI